MSGQERAIRMSFPSKYFLRAYINFKDDKGKDFELTPGQEEIFRVIYEPSISRAVIKTITQYGKSEVASMALISAMSERREKVLVLSPSMKQSSIIMGKMIQHLFDNPKILGMLEYTGSKLEQLKEERSKSRVTLKNGSEVMMLTAEATTVAREARNLMGFGASVVLVDESALIPDPLFSKILRMVGGVKDGKLIQLGNPFEDNHFGRAFKSDRYEKVSIDWRQALAEGRITQEFLNEAREEMSELDWTIFYECKFPEAGAEDALIPRDWIENAVNQAGCEGGHQQTGLDVARFGRDKTVLVYRKGGKVEVIEQTEKMDTMEVTGWDNGFLQEYRPDVHCTDSIGVGSGVHDRLEEIQGELDVDEDKDWSECELVPVNVGEAPVGEEAGQFFNLRAQILWHLRDLFKPDKNGHSQISIPDDPELKKQLGEIRYKYSSERKRKIEAKDEMKKRLGVSPDKLDALALAFWDSKTTEPDMVIVET
jgi:hypothetical protein